MNRTPSPARNLLLVGAALYAADDPNGKVNAVATAKAFLESLDARI